MTSLDGEEECNSEDAFPTLDWHVNSDHGEPPLTFDSSTTFPSPSLESSCNPFEESFRNAQHWETWDRDSISTASFQGNVPNVSNDLHYATDLYSMITTTPAEGENPFHYTLGRTSPEYNNTTTSDFVYPAMTTSPLSTTSFMGYNTGEQIDINKSYTDHTTKLLSTATSSSKTKPKRSSTNRHAKQNRVGEHDTTEMRYRGRMNNEFATLFSALHAVGELGPSVLEIPTM